MENKRYLNKVLDHLVRNTKIDYEIYDKRYETNGIITFPFRLTLHTSSFSLPFHLFPLMVPTYSFEIYCKNQFGLTDDEVSYVWEEYKKIIKEKINQ